VKAFLSGAGGIAMKFGRLRAAAIGGALATVVSITGANASTIYTYTGNNLFPELNFTPPNGSYDTSMSVTGSFTVSDTFVLSHSPMQLGGINAFVESFSFSDGRNTITNLNATTANFIVQLDGLGNITFWFVTLTHVEAGFPDSEGSQSWKIETNTVFDKGTFLECHHVAASSGCEIFADVGRNFETPGTWSASTLPAAVPAPVVGAGLPGLMFVGGGLLAWSRRKRQVIGIRTESLFK
jgi:hypothetical protein